MITVRKAADRGHANHGWLDSRHTFSFSDYHDPAHTHFHSLRVINEDRVAPGEGFGRHPHNDMEILTWVLAGALRHEDSLGNAGVIRPGELQRMSAGTGVVHSEMNGSATEPVHFLQIWIFPERKGLAPGYEQESYPVAARQDQLRLLAAPAGRDGAVTIHQDAALYTALLGDGKAVTHALAPGRHGWLQVARGAVTLNGMNLGTGDGAAITDESALTLRATAPSEILLFDLA